MIIFTSACVNMIIFISACVGIILAAFILNALDARKYKRMK